MSLKPGQVTAKCVEISKCFVNKQGGFHEYDLEATLTTGDLARLAANIRQAGVLSESQLSAIAYAGKLDFRLLKVEMLPALQRLGWGELKIKGGRILRFEESIPPTQDILSTLGKEWEERSPTKIDRSSVRALAVLSKRPAAKEALLSELGVDDSTFTQMFQYGTQVNYLGSFRSTQSDSDLVWTPLYWSYRATDVTQFLQHQTDPQFDTLRKLTVDLSKYPGRPSEAIEANKGLLTAGIAQGYFPAIAVNTPSRGAFTYIFGPTPQFEAEPSKDIFEKARLIVGCVRHGQYHAEISKIGRPRALLRALVDGSIGPHSYAQTQYALLVINGICSIEKIDVGGSPRFRPVFIKTPENLLAAEVAAQMLAGEEPSAGAIGEPEVKKLLTTGVYSYSAELRQIRSKEKIVATEPFQRLMTSLQGGILE